MYYIIRRAILFHQITNGLVFGDLTEDIIYEVIKK